MAGAALDPSSAAAEHKQASSICHQAFRYVPVLRMWASTGAGLETPLWLCALCYRRAKVDCRQKARSRTSVHHSRRHETFSTHPEKSLPGFHVIPHHVFCSPVEALQPPSQRHTVIIVMTSLQALPGATNSQIHSRANKQFAWMPLLTVILSMESSRSKTKLQCRIWSPGVQCHSHQIVIIS